MVAHTACLIPQLYRFREPSERAVSCIKKAPVLFRGLAGNLPHGGLPADTEGVHEAYVASGELLLDVLGQFWSIDSTPLYDGLLVEIHAHSHALVFG